MKDIVTRESCPEWSGYNTQLARQTGMAIEPKAKVVYLPLIDSCIPINNTHSNRERSNLAERCRDGTEYPSIYGRSTTVQGHSRHPVPHSIILHERNPYPWGYAHSHGFHSCHLHHPLSRIESHSFCDIRKCGQYDEREEVPSKLQGFKNANRRDAPQPLA